MIIKLTNFSQRLVKGELENSEELGNGEKEEVENIRNPDPRKLMSMMKRLKMKKLGVIGGGEQKAITELERELWGFCGEMKLKKVLRMLVTLTSTMQTC